MKELITWLNTRTNEYNAGCPTVSDKEWDEMYFQLQQMERDSGIIYPESPTQSIHYMTVSKLRKKTHNHSMLSLDKTKDWNEFINYFKQQPAVTMLKLDGLTCSLTYRGGRLVSAETRGNGEIGEDILHNILVNKTVPNRICNEDDLTVDGEIICTMEDFKPFEKDYKNPRNFAAGSIRLLNSKESAARNLTFVAWNMVEGTKKTNSFSNNLQILRDNYYFKIVPTTNDFNKEMLFDTACNLGYPIDGLVARFDDVEYGDNLGQTNHHAKAALAFKTYDEEYETSLLDIEWGMGRTGKLTPIAIFEPIDIDGTIIERASLHNYTVMKQTFNNMLGWVGQKVKVAKMNMIIPQITEAEMWTEEKECNCNYIETITHCPICGEVICLETSESGVQNLYCSNDKCEGKFINKLDHFCGKKGLDIKGLSTATLSLLYDNHFIDNLVDIFKLNDKMEELKKLPGLGARSVSNLIESINNAKTTTLAQFIAALGIPLIGARVSKTLADYVHSYPEFRAKVDNHFDWSILDTFADAKSFAINNFDYTQADLIFPYLTIISEKTLNVKNTLDGATVCITGKLKTYKNRDAFAADIEAHGGKVSSSVSAKTTYLVNNDITSESSKNIKAKQLNIPILTEQEFIEKFEF